MSPLINTEGNRWTHTCPNCWVPDKIPILTGDDEDPIQWVWPPVDYERTHRISKRTGEYGKKALNLPDRCQPCNNKYKRRLRMRKRILKLVEITNQLPATYSKPKLLTFALPVSTSEHYHNREDLIEVLNAKRTVFNRVLKEHGVLGSIYVIECTSRLANLDRYPEGFMQWKHHPHIHMVSICKYIHPTKFKEFTQCLRPYGLGSIDVEIVRIKTFDNEINYSGVRKIGSYITKYLTKDGKAARTVGVMRGSIPPTHVRNHSDNE